MPELSLLEAAKILGTSPNANIETLKKKFKERALETHPDRGGDINEFKKVNAAFRRLMRARTTKDISMAGFSDFEHMIFVEDDIINATINNDFRDFVNKILEGEE